ncbi:hypothetical protein IBTHAUMO2_1090017 [Nitrosopumilaceae archaeon]|nr:hypothetical protein IBTHAUMO2_1090017 [Nitrosopumilaceae archaeon]
MRRGKRGPNRGRSEHKEDYSLDEILTNISIRGSLISNLDYTTTTHHGDDKITGLCRHYGLFESYGFILAVDHIGRLSSGAEKPKVDAVRPLVSWLLNYKDGLRYWRNRRVGHLDDTDVPTLAYHKKHKIPFSLEDLAEARGVILFLHKYITDMYMDRLLPISKDLVAKEQKEAMDSEIRRNDDLAGFKEDAIKKLESISHLFQEDEYASYLESLRRL